MVPGRDEHLVDYSSIPVVNTDYGESSCASSDKLTDAVQRSIVSSLVLVSLDLRIPIILGDFALYLYIFGCTFITFRLALRIRSPLLS